MTPEYHGFTGADLDRPIYLGGVLGLEKATSARSSTRCAPITAVMSASNICTSPMSKSAASSRSGWRARTRPSVHADGKKAILSKVIQAEQWERFCGKKYVGTKRFGLDGGEAMIPAMESIIKYGGRSACARSCTAWRIAAG
jgi:2-oxoglutarate dehydrogenase E1 component